MRGERAEYASWYAQYVAILRDLLAASNDLRDLTGPALGERRLLNLARYLAVPPISLDDLDTLTDSCFGLWVGQKTERGACPTGKELSAAARIISERLDDERAPWLAKGRKPTAAERDTFIKWMASIPAASKLTTTRRGERSRRQEELTRAAVKAAGYRPVTPPGKLMDPTKDMDPGTYSERSRGLLGTNIDVPTRLKASHATG